MQFSLIRVLIDDRLSLATEWVRKGGIFIHHTDTERTLNLLREQGIIDQQNEGNELPTKRRKR